MDDADYAAIQEEQVRRELLKKARSEQRELGKAWSKKHYCLFCGELIKEKGRRWCNADCRDQWEQQKK